jgi:hypothetical protein
MIKDIGSYTIDLSKVERVGAVEGDPSWLRYSVHFTSGGSIIVHENVDMKREVFVNLWRETKNH